VTGPYIHDSILALIFSLMSYVPSAIIEENSMGTVPFAIRFFKLTLFINLFYSVLCLVIGLTLIPGLLSMPAMGLWPIIFCDMVI